MELQQLRLQNSPEISRRQLSPMVSKHSIIAHSRRLAQSFATDIARREITSSLSPRQIDLTAIIALVSSLIPIVVKTVVNGVTTTIGQVGGFEQNNVATAAALVTTLAPVASNTVVILTNGVISIEGTAGAITEALGRVS